MRTENNIINCHQSNTFLVKFLYQLGNSTYIVQREGLIEVLEKEDKNGVDYIKQFDFKTNSFKRISKKDILKQFTFDTEILLYLEKHYYFR